MDRTRELDRVKADLFTGSNAAFLGCLLCSLDFQWSDAIDTAGVTDTSMLWNPDFFDQLTKEERKGVLLHELWHLALLHSLRMDDRDPEKWNSACDLRINANLIRDGYSLPKGALYDARYEDDFWCEEDIYNDLPDKPKIQSWGSVISKNSTTDPVGLVSRVQSAVSAARLAGKEAGNAEKALTKFLRPVLPWKNILRNYLLERLEQQWSWLRPNRRFTDMYMPSLTTEDGRLTKICMFLDTSGSIDDQTITRFTSEVKYVQEVLNPKDLVVIQFDHRIREETHYNENTPFKTFKAKGFGGTSYTDVHDYIVKNKPTLSIIFTDLFCTPMEPVGKNEVVWVVNSDYSAPFGKTIHVS